MYIPAAFRESRLDVLHGLMRAYSFGTLVSQLDGELWATHLPLLVDEARGPYGTLFGHIARPNPHARAFGSPALAIFQGPHGYISPSWYSVEPAVPTWNYVVVHAAGTPRAVDEPRRIRAILDQTVATYEQALPRPWSMDGLPAEWVANMALGVIAFEMEITRIEGKYKLNQNRSADDVAGAAQGVRAHGGANGEALAHLMLGTA